jgi:hypothetical protein
MVREILSRILTCVGWSAAVVGWKAFLQNGLAILNGSQTAEILTYNLLHVEGDGQCEASTAGRPGDARSRTRYSSLSKSRCRVWLKPFKLAKMSKTSRIW